MIPSTPIASPSPPPRHKKRFWKWPVVALTFGFIGWLVYTQFLRTREGHGDVLFAVATRSDLVITVTEQGELQSRDAQPIVNEVGGGREAAKLVEILPEGSQVKKGDEVARIDNETILKMVSDQELKVETADGKFKASKSALEVAKNKADGEVAKADLELTLAKLDFESYEEGEFSVAQDKNNAALELAKRDLAKAEDSLSFSRDMVKKGFLPTEQLRQLEFDVQSGKFKVMEGAADLKVLVKFTKVRKLTELKAKYEEATRNLARAKKTNEAEVEKARSEVTSCERTLKLEQQELVRAKQQLEKCIIKAPADGIVVYDNSRPWDPNSKIRPGALLHQQQPIFTLPDLSKLQVKVKVHESVVKKVRAGQTASMSASSLPNQVLRGSVIKVATFAQNDEWRGGGAVKEFLTEVSIDNLPSEAGLKPGMTAEVKIAIQTLKDVITIPVNGVTEINGEKVCYVMTSAGIERRVVTVGEGNELVSQIIGGLKEGERVALDARTRGMAETKANASPPKGAEKPEASPSPTTTTAAAK